MNKLKKVNNCEKSQRRK